MDKPLPYWHPEADWSRESFFIRKLTATAPSVAGEIPEASIPLFGFVYVIEGEILVKSCGEAFLCKAGQLLIIPERVPFAVSYYDNSLAYAGGFALNLLKDLSYRVLHGKEPVLHAFWFDDATFVAGLLQKADEAFQRKDLGLVARLFDLILYSMDTPGKNRLHPVLNRFMERVFDRTLPLESVAQYAQMLHITPGYLNKLSRKHTLHTAIEWVEIARVNRAKTLLKDPSLSIADVSQAVGIDDPSYFARFFKKQAHLSPTEYRARQLKNRG